MSDVQQDLARSMNVPSLCLRLAETNLLSFSLTLDIEDLSKELARTLDEIYVVEWTCQHCLDPRTAEEVNRDKFCCPLCNLTDVCPRCRLPHTLTAEQAELAECDPGSTHDICFLCMYNMTQHSDAEECTEHGLRYSLVAQAITKAVSLL